jgi:hypothetical protein
VYRSPAAMEARHWDWGRAIPELGFHVLDFSNMY